MGNDGGSIPTRRELVKEAAKNPTTTQLKETIKEQQGFLWSTDPLSHKRLARPIVSDSAGNLYNKDAVLQYLLPDDGAGSLNKEDCERVLGGRVKGLKDVVEVQFEISKDQDLKDGSEKWICPVTSKELGPAVKAVYLVPCGHAFSAEAIKEMKGNNCLQCDTPYEQDNVIPILPFSEEEMNRLRTRAEKLVEQGLTHSLKKAPGSSKKRKAQREEQTAQIDSLKTVDREGAKALVNGSGNDTQPLSRASTPQQKSGTSTPNSAPGAASGIKNAATASLTQRVLQEEAERKKRRRLMGIENENIKTLFSNADTRRKEKDGDFMTRGFSVRR